MIPSEAASFNQPMTLAILMPSDPVNLGLVAVEGEEKHIAIAYKAYDPQDQKVYSGLIPPSEITFVDGYASFPISMFGTFQSVKFAQEVSEAKRVESSDPQIRNAKNEVLMDELGPGAPIFSIDQPAKGEAIDFKNIANLTFTGFCSHNGQTLEFSGSFSDLVVCSENRFSFEKDLSSIDGTSFQIDLSFGRPKSDSNQNPKTYSKSYNYNLKQELSLSFADDLESLVTSLNESFFQISGLCQFGAGSVILSGAVSEEEECTAPNRDGQSIFTFNLDLSSLSDGFFELTISQSTANGISKELTKTFEKNTQTPTITLTQPLDGFYVNASGATNLHFSGTCTEKTQKITVTGSQNFELTCGIAGTFSEAVDISGLADGPLSFTFTQDNDYGSSSKALGIVKNTSTPYAVFPEDSVTIKTSNLGATQFGSASGAGSDTIVYAGNGDSYTWEKVSGPGAVTFSQSNSTENNMSFSAIGSYVVKLTSSSGGQNASDQITVVVQAPSSSERAISPSSLSAQGIPGIGVRLSWSIQSSVYNVEDHLVVYFEGNSSDWAVANNWRPADGTAYSSGDMLSHEGHSLTVGADPSMCIYGCDISGLNAGSTYYFLVFGMDSLNYYAPQPSNASASVTAAINAFLSSYGGKPKHILIDGDDLYLGMSGTGIHIFDISSGFSLTKVINSTGYEVQDMVLDSGRLYALYDDDHVSIFDISTPASASRISEISLPQYSYTTNIQINGTHLYIGASLGGSHVYDVSNAASPSLVSSSLTFYLGFSAYDSGASSDRLLSIGNGLNYWDVSTSSALSLADADGQSTSPYLMQGLANHSVNKFYGSFITGSYRGMRYISTASDTISLGAVWQFTPSNYTTNLSKIAVNGDYAFMNAAKGIYISDVTGHADIHLSTYSASTDYDTSGIALYSSKAYLADDKGVTEVDISDPTSPTKGSVHDGIALSPSDIAVSGNYAFLVEGRDLKVMDLTSLSALEYKAKLRFSGSDIGSKIIISGNYAYISETSGGFFIVDVGTDPLSPAIVASGSAGTGLVYSMVHSGNYLYLTTSDTDTLEIYDVSTPGSIQTKGSLSLTNPSALVYSGGKVLLADFDDSGDREAFVKVVDVSDPDNPSLDATVTVPCDQITDLGVSGNYLFATQSAQYPCAAKLSVLDISSITSPSFVNAISLDSAQSLEISGDDAYVGGGNDGLMVVDISDATNLTIEAAYTSPKFLANFSLYGTAALSVSDELGLYVLSPLSN
ncbi:MAG: LVIVD repeat-containing protein [Oligoflexales bacterium]